MGRIAMGCTKVELRLYRTGDLLAIVQLDELCFSEEFRFDRQAMREFAEAQNAITLIAEDEGGGLVGFVITQLGGSATGKHGYIVTLDVSPENRRCRVGDRLMNEMEGRARLAGAAWMELHVFAKNDGAIRFYERQGYLRVGIKTNFYGRNLDAFVYRKDL
jgi:[ribosomal protein S18]-alanine N-acetyltransferase